MFLGIQYTIIAFIWDEHQPESNCFPPRALGLTTRYSPDVKAVTVKFYRNYCNMFITWMFCFVEDDNIISGILVLLGVCRDSMVVGFTATYAISAYHH